jgi:branched-chain amino acid aminotransferase group I
LIRDPVAVLSSWGCASSVHGSNPTPDEVGIVPLLAIYSQLQSRQRQGNAQQQPATTTNTNNNTVVVLDADELIEHPEAVLQTLCERLQIEYKVWMMKWKAGPHLCDGPWASWWYHDVWKSSGWNTVSSSNKDDDDDNSHGTPTSTTTGVVTRRRYRTLHPSLMDSLRASLPAYQFLKTLTRRHQTRGPTSSSSTSTILYEDARNQELLVWIGAPGRGQLLPRDMASVSPWDSAVQGGDAVWEGLRVYRGKILHLDKHLRRLFKSAKAMGFERVHGKEEIVQAIFQTLAANGMRDGAHIRLTLTRGEKSTSSMNPKFNVYGTTLIVLAEWKPTQGATTYDNDKGVALISASQRRNSPNTVDSKIHHNNLINNILPKIQANLAGAADAIMLDVDGFVSETNATNLFLVDDGALYTPHADHCLPGITRQCVMELASNELHIPVVERRLSLAEFHSADEVFTTGTMGELTPVVMIDGRVIGSGQRGPVTAQLQAMYRTLPDRDECATALPEFEAFVMD